MSDENKKKSTGLLATLIIGGAIGSVLGLTMAPQKGSKTRKAIKKKTGELLEKGAEFAEKIKEQEK